jgi:hypothetical protein
MIAYKNDGKCKDSSWEATINVDTSIWHCYGFTSLTAYGECKREAHDNLICALQSMLHELHSAMLSAEAPPKDTPEERAERHRARYGHYI